MAANPAASYSKDPNAVLDYVIDWTAWLNGDTLISSTWTLDAGIANVGQGMSGSQTLIWISGGAAGSSYQVRNTITTQGGRTDERTFQINAVLR